MSTHFQSTQTMFEYDANEDRLYNGRLVVTEKLKLSPKQLYKQFEMTFLENPILVYLSNPCNLIKTKFNYVMQYIDQRDKNMLNTLFQHINPKLKCNGNSMYINGRVHDLPEFIDVSEENTKIVANDNIDAKYMVGIQITGYKTGPNGFVSVVWRLITAQPRIKRERTVVQ